jgi:PleD family two-component response regulator
VLVLDDRPAHLRNVAQAVASLGHDVHTAPDRQAALAMLERMNFDLVLLAVAFQVADRTEVIRSIKADSRLSLVPLIVIYAGDEDMDGIAVAGDIEADDFLAMPSDTLVLRARIGACVERKRLRAVELQYIEHVHLLAEAAQGIEAGNFDPRHPQISQLAARTDGLGRLARVIASLAAQLFEREEPSPVGHLQEPRGAGRFLILWVWI